MKRINFKESSTCAVDFFHTNKNYSPISCDVYDHLEIWSMKGTNLSITFEDDKIIKNITSKIKTLSTEKGVEYLVTMAGERIRLDCIHIIEER